MSTIHPIDTARLPNLIGQKFGYLTVVRAGDREGRYRRATWICACECGQQTKVAHRHIKSKTISCGCKTREEVSRAATKHGLSSSRTYRIWIGLRQRCGDPSTKAYVNYGGRGIKVCARWESSFENFVADMGLCPADASIDRVNNDGGYEPSNCRWSTRSENARNKRSNRLITINGETKPLIAWVEHLGQNLRRVQFRIYRAKWNPIDALLIPPSQGVKGHGRNAGR